MSDDSDENKVGSDKIDDIQLLRIAREEAHRTVDHQVATLNDIDTKAAKILRPNLILLGIVLTGVSLVSNGTPTLSAETSATVGNLENFFIGVGFSSLLVSTAIAALTYTASSVRKGMSGRDLRQLLRNDYQNEQNLAGIVDSYADWMQYNFRVNTRNAPLGTLTLLFLVYAIVFLSTGVYHTFVAPVTAVPTTALTVLLALFSWRTGIIRQIRRYWRYRGGGED